MLTLGAGDDAAAVMWLEVDEANPAYRALYASHKMMVDLVYETHGQQSALAAGVELSSGGMCAGARPCAEVAGLSLVQHGWIAAAACGGSPGQLAPWLSLQDLLDIFSVCPSEGRSAVRALKELVASPDDLTTCTRRVRPYPATTQGSHVHISQGLHRGCPVGSHVHIHRGSLLR